MVNTAAEERNRDGCFARGERRLGTRLRSVITTLELYEEVEVTEMVTQRGSRDGRVFLRDQG